jgi:hypothetical protein
VVTVVFEPPSNVKVGNGRKEALLTFWARAFRLSARFQSQVLVQLAFRSRHLAQRSRE